MPARGWRLRIQDILESIEKIQRYVSDMTLEEFLEAEMVVDAVVRNFTIIGEASRHVPEELEERWPDVPWYEMRGMRNVVVHEYFGVSREILWGTVRNDLPPLVPMLHKILENETLDDP